MKKWQHKTYKFPHFRKAKGRREREERREGEGEPPRTLLGVWNVKVCTSWQHRIGEEGGAGVGYSKSRWNI